MKTKILVLLLTLALLLTACTSSAYEDYVNAEQKTSDVASGERIIEVNFTGTLDESKLSDAQIADMKPYTHFDMTVKETFDNTNKQYRYDFYVNTGNVGFDMTAFIDTERIILDVPLIGKKIAINPAEVAEHYQDQAFNQPLEDTTIKAIGALYFNTFGTGDVAVGEDALMETPDGKVKAKRYSIAIDDQKWLTFIKQALDIVAGDNKLASILNTYEIKLSDVISAIRETMASVDDLDLTIEKFLDSDYYIVDETLTMKSTLSANSSIFSSIELSVHDTLGRINDTITIAFPDTSAADVLTVEQLEQYFKEQNSKR